VGNKTSTQYNNKDFQFIRDTYIDKTERTTLEIIRFQKNWLNYDFPSSVLCAADVGQWVREERRKALDSLESEVQQAVKGYKKGISNTVRARVKGYDKEALTLGIHDSQLGSIGSLPDATSYSLSLTDLNASLYAGMDSTLFEGMDSALFEGQFHFDFLVS
jgi:hypothetical protein